MDNALIIDLVLAAVLAVFALLGARKGLIRSLMALVSVVVALIGATLLTAMFVEPVTDLVYPKVEERVLEQFERDIPSDALAAEDGDLSAGGLLPDELSEALGEALDTLKRFGVSDDAIDGVTKSVTDSAVSAAERAAYLLVKTIVQAALFLAFFLALMLLLRLLTHGLDRLFSLPVLAQLNVEQRVHARAAHEVGEESVGETPGARHAVGLYAEHGVRLVKACHGAFLAHAAERRDAVPRTLARR